MKKLIVILPAFNEASVIKQTLTHVKRAIQSLPLVSEIVVINDGSQDQTGPISRQAGVTVITHRLNRGLGASLGTGLEYARRRQADFAITMDSDGQHDPQDIKLVLKPLLEGQADVVIGSRLLKKPSTMPWLRQLNNRCFNLISWFLFGIRTSDSLSGFRGFSQPAIQKIKLKTERMEVSNEFFSEIKKNKFRLVEVPIRVIYTPYSLAKGVQPSNVFAIVFRLLLRLFR
jgi:glycosyltransferase involved in cell wall biosynthesis